MHEVVALRFDPEHPGDKARFAVSETGTERGGAAAHGGIHVSATPMDFIVEALAAYGYERPVIDETGLTGMFDMNIVWRPGDTESIDERLAQLGFEILHESREIPILVIEPGSE